MYLAKTKNQKGTYLAIIEAYRKNGRQSKKTIKAIGYLEDLVQQYPDPIAHFTKMAEEMNAKRAAENSVETISYRKNELLPEGAHQKNFGYAALSSVYHWLGLDRFFHSRERRFKPEFDLNSVMKLLVYSRVLWPGSKQAAFAKKDCFFDKMDFELHDVYRALTYADKLKDDAQLQIRERIAGEGDRDMAFVFYDVTNYYFEIDEEDELRRKGASKEHRPDPIVQLGLFMDNGGLPIAYRLFPGNNNDCTTLLPFIKSVRQRYGIGKAVVVADKGMNTQQNAYYLANGRGGYIFSQTVAGGTKELKGYVLKEGGYERNADGSFKKKSRQFTRRVDFTEVVEGENGEKTENRVRGEIQEKQVVFWSKDYALKAKADREKAVQKAKELIKCPGKYNKYTDHGAAKYVKNLQFDKDGEIVEPRSKLVFDSERLAEEELYDGYYVIATSCHDATDDWVIDHYRGLWEIEATFKVTKGDLHARPVFVKRRDHIEAHFLVCFIALVLVRVIQKRLGGAYSTTRIVDAMRNVNCIDVGTNTYAFGYRDEVTDALGEKLGIDFQHKYMKTLDIRKSLGGTKRDKG